MRVSETSLISLTIGELLTDPGRFSRDWVVVLDDHPGRWRSTDLCVTGEVEFDEEAGRPIGVAPEYLHMIDVNTVQEIVEELEKQLACPALDSRVQSLSHFWMYHEFLQVAAPTPGHPRPPSVSTEGGPILVGDGLTLRLQWSGTADAVKALPAIDEPTVSNGSVMLFELGEVPIALLGGEPDTLFLVIGEQSYTFITSSFADPADALSAFERTSTAWKVVGHIPIRVSPNGRAALAAVWCWESGACLGSLQPLPDYRPRWPVGIDGSVLLMPAEAGDYAVETTYREIGEDYICAYRFTHVEHEAQ